MSNAEQTNVEELTQEEIDEATPEQAEALRSEVLRAQGQVSDAVLKSELGWDVVRAMGHKCVDLHLSTRSFTTGVINTLPKLERELEDPEGFKKTFHTLIRDLGEFHDVITTAHKRHIGRKGKPSEDEVPLVMELSLEYSKIQDYFEAAVRPLWIQLLQTIETQTDGVLYTTPQAEGSAE